jgi:hypothetical protein
MINIDDIPIIDQIDKFMISNHRALWLDNQFMKIYVRRAFHLIEGNIENTFDIANVTVNSAFQRKGYFKNVIQHVEKFQLTVYVESISNLELMAMLIKNGYTIDSTGYNAYKKP